VITALVVDDEPPARARLVDLLAEHPDVGVCAEAGTVAEAMRAILEHRPDAVFLDIRLPDQDGFAVVDLVGLSPAPAYVFVTAYADHAARAFDVQAVDYLLKPYSRARLATALGRVRLQLRQAPGSAAAPPLSRLPVTTAGRVSFVDVAAVHYISAERNYARLVTGSRSYLLRSTLSALEDRLVPGEFVRVSRSALARITSIVEVEPLPHGELLLRITGGAQLICSRQQAAQVRSSLGM